MTNWCLSLVPASWLWLWNAAPMTLCDRMWCYNFCITELFYFLSICHRFLAVLLQSTLSLHGWTSKDCLQHLGKTGPHTVWMEVKMKALADIPDIPSSRFRQELLNELFNDRNWKSAETHFSYFSNCQNCANVFLLSFILRGIKYSPKLYKL